MAQSTELRVFISSTFRDLQAEREHLVKKIFPEIRALCRARDVTFTDIDLRWGITEEEAEREGIIQICLDEIDRCRPYFIGILGERYGWTPPRTDAERIAHRFPVLGSRVLDGASITEMEIVHGVLANPAMVGHAFFYFRDHNRTPEEFVDTDPDITLRLRDLKERIRSSGFPVRENFTSPGELGAWIQDDLQHVVDIEHPESETPSPLELERRAHRAFAASRTRAYVANPEYDKLFNDWIVAEGRGVRGEGLGTRAEGRGVRDGGRGTETDPPSLIPEPSSLSPHPSSLIPEPSSLSPHPSSLIPEPSSLSPHPSSLIPEPSALVITAESGLGKSSLIAHLVDEYRKRHPAAFVIEHYVGATQAGGTAGAIMRHIVDEIRERFTIDDEVPGTAEELERRFPNWLFSGEQFAMQEGIEFLIVIDAVNQLDRAGQGLAWLPQNVPPGVRLVVSTTPGVSAEQLATRGWAALDVRPIDDQAVRSAIVLQYLGEFHKGITATQVRRVTTDAKAASPLFLRVVAEELRLHGEHETLDAAIDRFADAADLPEVFDRVLERLDQDHGADTVRNVMSDIWASRAGLAEHELMAIASLNRLELSRLLFALDYHLVQREGLLGFFHGYLRSAVEKRYLSTETLKRRRHSQLADYFHQLTAEAVQQDAEGSSTGLPLRFAGELTHQLEMAGEEDRLASSLGTIPVFLALYAGGEAESVLRLWKKLGESRDVEALYAAAIVHWRSVARSPTDVCFVLGKLAAFFGFSGRWEAALRYLREQVECTEASGIPTQIAEARSQLAHRLHVKGDSVEALEMSTTAYALAKELGAETLILSAIETLANIHLHLGHASTALGYLQEAFDIQSARGDRGGMAWVLSKRSGLHYTLGQFEEAVRDCDEAISIHRARTNRHGLSIALISRANAMNALYRFEGALENLREAGEICQQMGNTYLLSVVLTHQGITLLDRGEYSHAVEYFDRAAGLSTSLGHLTGVAIAIGNSGLAFVKLRQYEQALGRLFRAKHECRTRNFPYGLTYWLEGSARVLLELSLTAEAMPPYLIQYLPDARADTWRAECRQAARMDAEESLNLSVQLSKDDTRGRCIALVARVDAAEGKLHAAEQRLRSALRETSDGFTVAELNFWLWNLCADADAKALSLRGFQTLWETAPRAEVQERIAELTGGGAE